MEYVTGKLKFVPVYGANNMMADCGDFKISFNPDTFSLGQAFAGDSEEETALCVAGQYFILNGDFRDAYAPLADDGLKACLQFFIDNAAFASKWSGTVEQARIVLEHTP